MLYIHTRSGHDLRLQVEPAPYPFGRISFDGGCRMGFEKSVILLEIQTPAWFPLVFSLSPFMAASCGGSMGWGVRQPCFALPRESWKLGRPSLTVASMILIVELLRFIVTGASIKSENRIGIRLLKRVRDFMTEKPQPSKGEDWGTRKCKGGVCLRQRADALRFILRFWGVEHLCLALLLARSGGLVRQSGFRGSVRSSRIRRALRIGGRVRGSS